MSKIRLSKDMIGNKVRCVNKIDIHHPEPGTIGTIVMYDEFDAICNYKVQWPKGSTVGDDRWWAINKCIELVEDDMMINQGKLDMTNEEIWEMLQNKMVKNGLKKKMGALYCCNTLTNGYWVYTPDDVHNAIALAYKVGYLRAMKGRPFKIGENKRGVHWEPVNLNNLPKEGTRVRLNKPYDNYYGGIIEAGTVGCVFHDASYSSRVNGYGVDFGEYKTIWFPLNRTVIADCLDMWVEDDE